MVSVALIATSLVTATEASAAPSAANTGVPAGTKLTKHTGDLKITKAGTVVSGLDVHGNVIVKAANVTITKTRIRGAKATNAKDLLIAQSTATGFKITDSTIAPAYPSVHQRNGIRLAAKGAIAQRVDVSGTVDGVRVSASNVRVENSYMHDFRHFSKDPYFNGKPSHDDAIQIEGGSAISIANNTFSGAYNAGIFVGQGLSTISNLSITSNNANGGGCTINIVKNSKPFMKGMKVNGNKFGRNSRVKNCPLIYTPSHSDLKPSGNVWADNGKAIPLPKG